MGIRRDVLDETASKLDVHTRFLTVHKAKGTESDYVILLDDRMNPIQTHERAADNRALAPLRSDAHSPTDEERRIWYVALSRAKRKTYVVVPPWHRGLHWLHR